MYSQLLNHINNFDFEHLSPGFIDTPSQKNIFFSQDSKLNSAIRNYNILDLLNIDYLGKELRPPLSKFEKLNFSKFTKLIPDYNNKTITVDPSRIIGTLFEECLYNKFSENIEHEKELRRAIRIAMRRLNIELPIMGKIIPHNTLSIPKLTDEQIDSIIPLYQLRATLRQLVAVTSGNKKCEWNGPSGEIKCLNPSEKPVSRVFHVKITKFDIYSSQRFLFITDNQDINIMSNRQHTTMLHDIVTQRFSAYIQSMVASNLGYEFYPSVYELSTLFKLIDRILKIHGNKGYAYIKNFEAICTSIILENDNDPICENEAFILNLESTISEILNSESIRIHKIVKALLTKMFHENMNKVTQCFGLYRIWGHPIIDEIEGLRKLQNIACTHRDMSAKSIYLVTNTFKELFVTRYYRKNHKWPPLIFKEYDNNYLKKRYLSGKPLNLKDKRYNISQWSNVDIEQVFDIPTSIDLADVVNDTSQSLNLDQLLKELLENKTCGTRESKSVLLNFLNSDFINPKEFFLNIDKKGFKPESHVYGASPKEREESEYGRFFGLDTSEVMLYFKLSEWLIAKFYLPYFPEITMKDDESTLSKKKFALTSIENNEKQWRVGLNVDFEKWNTNQRSSESKMISNWMDHSFGLCQALSLKHDILYTSLFMLMDNSFLPPLINKLDKTIHYPNGKSEKLTEEEWNYQKTLNPVFDHTYEWTIALSKVSWSNHLGGMEGKCQKFWSIMYAAAMDVIKRKHENLQVSLILQGDNMYLMIKITSRTASPLNDLLVKSLVKSFFSDLEDFFNYFGAPLKMSESWSSSFLFAYGKNLVFKNTDLCMDMKRSIRAYECNNEGITTLGSSLSSITACIMGATTSSYTYDIPLFIYALETQLCLFFHLNNSLLRNKKILNTKNRQNKGKDVFLNYIYPVSDGGVKKVKFLLPGRLHSGNISDLELSDLGILLLNWIPPSLGGLPILLIPAMVARGFPDPLTLDISILKIMHSIIKNTSPIESRLIECILSPKLSEYKNFRLLFEDPVALNLPNPSTPEERSKRRVGEYIAELTRTGSFKNKQYTTFLNAAFNDQSNYHETLSKMTPLNPRIANQIIAGSIFAVAFNFLQKLNNSGTIIKKLLYNHDNPEEFIENISDMEINKVFSLLSRPSFSTGEWKEDMCSTEWANELRKQSWGEITGVTVASPFEVHTGVVSTGLPCTDQGHLEPELGYVLITFSVGAGYQLNHNFPTAGNSVPYYGRKTQAKLNHNEKEYMKEVPSYARKAFQSQSLIGWATPPTGKLAELIRRTGGQFTSISLNFLESPDGAISGSWEHRQQDERTKKGGSPACNSTFSTLCHISTDNFTTISKGSINKNYIVQSILLLGQTVFGHNIIQNPQSIYQSYHLHVSCDRCIKPINETQVKLPEDVDLPTMESSLVGNTYCWVDINAPQLDIDVQLETIESNNNDYFDKLSKDIIGQGIIKDYLNQTIAQFLFEICFTKSDKSLTGMCNYSWIQKSNIITVLNYFIFRVFSKLIYQKRLNLTTPLNQVYETILSDIMDEIDTLTNGLSTYCQVPSSLDNFINIEEVEMDHGSLHLGSSVGSSIWNVSSMKTCLVKVIQILITKFITKGFAESKLFKYSILHRLPETPNQDAYLRSFLVTKVQNGLMVVTSKSERNSLDLILTALQSEYKNIKGSPSLLKSVSKLNINITKQMYLELKAYHDMFITSRIHPDVLASLVDKQDESLNESLSTLLYEQDFLNDHDFLYSVICKGVCSNQISRISVPINDPPQSFTFSKRTIDRLVKYRVPLDITSAPLKIIGMNNLIPNTGNGVFLGDGTGGFTKAYLMMRHSSKAYFGTIFRDKNMIPHIIGNAFPACLSGRPDLRSRLVALGVTREINQDITNHFSRNHIVSGLKALGLPFNFLMCDAEGSEVDRMRDFSIIEGSLAISSQLNISTCIIKSYYGSSEWVNMLFNVCMSSYLKVQIIRSHLSLPQNSEIYLVCEGLRSTRLLYQLKVDKGLLLYEGTGSVVTQTELNNHEIYLEVDTLEKLNSLMNKCLELSDQNKFLIEVYVNLNLFSYNLKRSRSLTWNSMINVLNRKFQLIKFQDEIDIRVNRGNILTFNNKLTLIYLNVIFMKLSGIQNKVILDIIENGFLYILKISQQNQFIAYLTPLICTKSEKKEFNIQYEVISQMFIKKHDSIRRSFNMMIGILLRAITKTPLSLFNHEDAKLSYYSLPNNFFKSIETIISLNEPKK
nr:MAG: RNA-dependent RNA polymerase [Rhabdoviridae sp.]